jgi:mRNA interferase RelE/StbE
MYYKYNLNMEIRYTKQAIKYLMKMQPKQAQTIRGKIQQIANGETEGLNIKYFSSESVYRLRVGGYRAIYEIIENELVLVVIKVGARGDVYK